MRKHQPMDKDAAARIQSAAARHPESVSAQTGFDRRAQSAADKHDGRSMTYAAPSTMEPGPAR